MAGPGQMIAEQAGTYFGGPQIRSVDASHVACTVCEKAQQRAAEDLERHERDEAGALGRAIENRDVTELADKDFLLEMAEGGVPLPLAGNVAGAAIGFLVADRKAQKQTQAIIDQHRDEIAMQLGIAEEAVDVRSLVLAAKDNIGLRQAIASIEDEKAAHPFVNVAGLIGMVGGLPLGLAMGSFIPIVGNLIGGLAGAGIGYWLGSEVGQSIMGPNVNHNPMIKMDELRAKLAEGTGLMPADVFGLRVSQQPGLQARIEQQYGMDYFDLSPQDQITAMRMYPDLAQQSARDALLCNQGADVDDLMFGFIQEPAVQEFAQLQQAAGDAPQQQPGSWAQKVGGPKAQQRGSHASAIRAQQQAAANQENMLQ